METSHAPPGHQRCRRKISSARLDKCDSGVCVLLVSFEIGVGGACCARVLHVLSTCWGACVCWAGVCISNSLLRRVWCYEIQSGSGAAQVRRAQRVLPEVCYALPPPQHSLLAAAATGAPATRKRQCTCCWRGIERCTCCWRGIERCTPCSACASQVKDIVSRHVKLFTLTLANATAGAFGVQAVSSRHSALQS